MQRLKLQVSGLVITSMLLSTCKAPQRRPPVPTPVPTRTQKFTYRGQTFSIDPYKQLFGEAGPGPIRKALFESYLQHSPEGKLRVSGAGSGEPEAVWQMLTVEEKTTFLAITAALADLEDETRVNLLEWLQSLESIHGENNFMDGSRFENNTAFRLFVRVGSAALAHLIAGRGQFRNLCRSRSFGYDALGSRHPDFCRLPALFASQRKTDNFPNLHFNFTPGSPCVDIDIDYRVGLAHLTRDNSNVLADNQILLFEAEYCDPGFR